MTSYDVAIVGAGLSGLACARELLQKQTKSKIMVIDARDRVGGRTYSVPFRDDAIDLGGQWVGPSQHRTLALLRELNLQTVKQLWFHTNGGPLSTPASVAPSGSGADYRYDDDVRQSPSSPTLLNSGSSLPLTDAEALELASISARLESWASTVREPSSWVRADAAAWDAISVKAYLDAHVGSPGVRRELDLLVRTVTASEPADLSFLYFLAFLAMCGGLAAVGDGDGGAQSFKVGGGAQQLARRLAAQLRNRGVEILLGAAVSRIDWGRSDGGAGAIEVTVTQPVSQTEAGGGEAGPGVPVPMQIRARKVVLAVSPPLWASIAWSPPLPADKAAVAQRMYMGAAVKTIAIYRTRFWAESAAAAPGRCSFPSPDDSAGAAPAPRGPSPASCAAAPASSAACCTPGAMGSPQQQQHHHRHRHHCHLEDLGPVANLFPATISGAPALIGLVTGAAAVAFAALPDAERRSVVLQQYERYFGSAAAQFDCTDFISKDWMHEPYSRGCFAALMPPGLAAGGGGASARKPLCGCRAGAGGGAGGVCAGLGECGGGLVFFAGTELAAEWAGYFEGAIEAGYRAAGEVATALMLPDRQPSRSRL